jgi:hypothetical protein
MLIDDVNANRNIRFCHDGASRSALPRHSIPERVLDPQYSQGTPGRHEADCSLLCTLSCRAFALPGANTRDSPNGSRRARPAASLSSRAALHSAREQRLLGTITGLSAAVSGQVHGAHGQSVRASEPMGTGSHQRAGLAATPECDGRAHLCAMHAEYSVLVR